MPMLTVYYSDTGKVFYTFNYTLYENQAATGQAEFPGYVDSATEYIDVSGAPKKASRPANTTVLSAGDNIIIANGVDEANFSSVPSGSFYEIIGPVQTNGLILDSVLDLTTDTMGTYTVKILSFPELDTEFTVTAT